MRKLTVILLLSFILFSCRTSHYVVYDKRDSHLVHVGVDEENGSAPFHVVITARMNDGGAEYLHSLCGTIQPPDEMNIENVQVDPGFIKVDMKWRNLAFQKVKALRKLWQEKAPEIISIVYE